MRQLVLIKCTSPSLYFCYHEVSLRSNSPHKPRRSALLIKPEVITVTHTGQRGRPTVSINQEILQEAMSSKRKISISALARALGVHRHTVRKQLQVQNIPPPQYSPITDEELDAILRAWKELRPESGIRYASAFLSGLGLWVQRDRVSGSLRHIDGLGQKLRNHKAIDRGIYVVPFANYLWHIDGHHKLIRWGIVIHGGADGYDRMVCF